jgi:hypothetical protein
MLIPTGMPSRNADSKVLTSEIIGEFVHSIRVEVSWRGKPTFEAGVTHLPTGNTEVTECSSYGRAKKAHRIYKRIYS